ncbi:MAG TPA: CoxF protein [Xanthobacteraceae bacterium]|nr:CoxF protein [Xanthobacteraceae bacterium]
MNDGVNKPPPFPPPLPGEREPGIKLTDAQLRARRSRSIAIGVALGLLAILFYIVTLVKGPGVLERPL